MYSHTPSTAPSHAPFSRRLDMTVAPGAKHARTMPAMPRAPRDPASPAGTGEASSSSPSPPPIFPPPRPSPPPPPSPPSLHMHSLLILLLPLPLRLCLPPIPGPPLTPLLVHPPPLRRQPYPNLIPEDADVRPLARGRVYGPAARSAAAAAAAAGAAAHAVRRRRDPGAGGEPGGVVLAGRYAVRGRPGLQDRRLAARQGGPDFDLSHFDPETTQVTLSSYRRCPVLTLEPLKSPQLNTL